MSEISACSNTAELYFPEYIVVSTELHVQCLFIWELIFILHMVAGVHCYFL